MAEATMVVASKVAQTASIILLHGRGDTGQGISHVGREIVKRIPFVKVILPTAPLRNINFGPFSETMTAWFDRSFSGPLITKAEGIEESRQTVNNLLLSEINSGIASNRILLVGFSQGRLLLS